MDNVSVILILALSLGQIIGLAMMVEMVVKKRSTTYQACMFIIVGTFPIFKIWLPHISDLSLVLGIAAAYVGAVFILTGMLFLRVASKAKYLNPKIQEQLGKQPYMLPPRDLEMEAKSMEAYYSGDYTTLQQRIDELKNQCQDQ
jgi:predicted membrane channel-forming protein YqfA (hemolysin III family)